MIDHGMQVSVCLLDNFYVVFLLQQLQTSGFKLASTITLVLQANRQTKCSNQLILAVIIYF